MSKQQEPDNPPPVEWEVIGLILKLIIFGGILIGIIISLIIGGIIWLASLVI